MADLLFIHNVDQLLYLAAYTIIVMLGTASVIWISTSFRGTSSAAETGSKTVEAEPKCNATISQPVDSTKTSPAEVKEILATEESFGRAIKKKTTPNVNAAANETVEEDERDSMRAKKCRNYSQLSVVTDDENGEKSCHTTTPENVPVHQISYPVDEETDDNASTVSHDDNASTVSPDDNAKVEDLDSPHRSNMEDLTAHTSLDTNSQTNNDTNIQPPVATQTDDVKETGNNHRQNPNGFNIVRTKSVYINVPSAHITSQGTNRILEDRQVISMLSEVGRTIVDIGLSNSGPKPPAAAPAPADTDPEPCCDSSPDYESSMKQGKQSSEVPSSSIELDGKTFNLETASEEEEGFREYEETPDDLVELITEICAEEDVSSATLYQSSSDSKQLWVVAVGADEKVEGKLQEAVKERFPGFTIFTDRIDHYSEHTINYAGKHAFIAVSELFNENKNRYEEVSTATCELILEGEAIAEKEQTHKSFYAFVPAHFVVDKSDCEMLLAEDVHEGAPKHVQENTARNSLNHRYFLQLFNPRKTITLRSADSMLAYRQYQHGADQGPTHFSSFYNDSCLMEVKESIFHESQETMISCSEVERGMKSRQDGKVIGDILPVKEAKQLVHMGTKRVRVEIGPSHGYMIFPGIPLQIGKKKKGPTSTQVNDRPQIHHAQLILDDWPLKAGHSGSIVYVIDADDGTRYPFGMLVGEARRHKRKDQTIFQAIVLQQAIDELAFNFRHKVRGLRQVGRSTSQTEEFAAIAARLANDRDSLPADTASQHPAGNCMKVPNFEGVQPSPACESSDASTVVTPTVSLEDDEGVEEREANERVNVDQTTEQSRGEEQYTNQEDNNTTQESLDALHELVSPPAPNSSSDAELPEDMTKPSPRPEFSLSQGESTASLYQGMDSQSSFICSSPKGSLATSKSNDSGFSTEAEQSVSDISSQFPGESIDKQNSEKPRNSADKSPTQSSD